MVLLQKKILHLISTLDIGGAETSLLKLVSLIDKKRFKSIVVSMTDIGPVGKKIQECGIPVHGLEMKKGLPDPRGIWRFSKLIQLHQPDIIQCWMYHANLLGLFFSSKKHVLWNIRCSDMDLAQYGLIYRLAVKAGAVLSGFPDRIIVNSNAGKEWHEGLGYHTQRWEIIPNGFDTNGFKPDAAAKERIKKELNIPPGAVVIGLIARLDPMKDHENFLKAAEQLLETHNEVHFILAGRSVTRENSYIQNLIKSVSKKEQIHLLGERLDISYVYAALDIASSSSYGEGFPNAVAEAMSTGVPCVVTDVGDSRYIVGDTGIVVPKKDPRALVSAWMRLIDNFSLRQDMGKAARDRIEKFYSLKAFVQRYEDLYSFF